MCHRETLYRLCIFCRTLEPMNGPCPVLQGEKSRISQTGRNVESDTLVSGLSPQDAELISALHQQPSSLCARCSAYDILGVLLKSDPTADPRQEYETQSFNDFTRSMLHVGRPSSVTLTASCPICRLFYCVLPRKYEPVRQITNGRKITRTTEADIYFEPRRTYLRLRNWDTLPKYLRKQCAVVLHMTESYLESSISRNSMPFSPSHSLTEKPRIYAPTIALEPRLAPPDRKLNSLRPISSNVDFSLLRQALGLCLEKHCTSCSTQKQKRPELLETRMIDIVERIVVPCPPDCDYVALSYVWGGVEPSPGSLKNRCLPQTIEDAITVTQALGRRYLWVDALCINQSEELTSSERKEKEKQLRWMGIIYGGATVTIVAVSGLNANAGLHGISVPRLAQVTENIDGYTLFTSPPSYFTETSETLWSRRAWTMQEHLLSKRLLFFSQSQVAFECREGLFEEVLHYTTKGDTIIDDTPHPSTSEDSLTRFLYGDEVVGIHSISPS
ncbi:Heterokaryon incompatibility [Penicillium expansum]|nr:Heterokaryon incompatibility [Penicillium expansum]